MSAGGLEDSSNLVLTFNSLTRDRKFIRLLRTALLRLEEGYNTPVDIEFTVEIVPNYPEPDYKLHILQCRPLSQREGGGPVEIPSGIPDEDVIFRTYELIPDGRVEGARYIVFADPRRYRELADPTMRLELGRVIGRLNERLANETFVLMGPGRWGSANLDLGIRVSYADIFNTRALIEIAVAGEDGIPELSYGTHFFQDLVEDGIHSLPIHLKNPESYFDWTFFEEAPNSLGKLLPQDAHLSPYLKVVDIAAIDAKRRLTILMDGSQDEAIGYLVTGEWRRNDRPAAVPIF